MSKTSYAEHVAEDTLLERVGRNRFTATCSSQISQTSIFRSHGTRRKSWKNSSVAFALLKWCRIFVRLSSH